MAGEGVGRHDRDAAAVELSGAALGEVAEQERHQRCDDGGDRPSAGRVGGDGGEPDGPPDDALTIAPPLWWRITSLAAAWQSSQPTPCGESRPRFPATATLRGKDLADGRQGSSVRAILDNPRYTGYAIVGQWTKHETLLAPEDVAADHMDAVQPRGAGQDGAATVSVNTFTQPQFLRRSKSAGGSKTARKAERGARTTARSYLLCAD
ncbi:hypothetical protein [Amycolatopsis sp. CA-128772]|uniref:hypothetical protein n=1 Tax=Amycolatopsis sp. CA-128772 TaxID=2073159 RepID=UPI001E3B20B8|nr:hypothetical protein [Amycolatopsis sp. CA-128772]